MSALVRSELIKIRTTRGWWAYLIVIVLLTGIAVAGEVGSAESSDRSTADFQLGLVETVGVSVLLAIILGIMMVTTEFRHGTVTPTFLATPHREQVVAAKAIAGVIVAVGFALLSLLVVFAVALPWFAIVGAEWNLAGGETATSVAEQILAAVLWVLIGVAVGAIVQSQVAALVGTLIWIFVGETLLLGLFGLLDLDGVRGYLPFQALDGADGTGGGDDLLSYWPAVGVSAAWIALIGTAGTERTRRRDIT
jgi:ABC-type transport system involved in multi-copper enzyme maturation permease subunit